MNIGNRSPCPLEECKFWHPADLSKAFKIYGNIEGSAQSANVVTLDKKGFLVELLG